MIQQISSPPFVSFPMNEGVSVTLYSKNWGYNPPASSPLPLLIIAGTPQKKLISKLLSHLQGVLIDWGKVKKRENVIQLLQEAGERNLPVILTCPPSQAEAVEFKHHVTFRFAPFTVLVEEEVQNTPFDLVLGKEWREESFPFIAALLSEKGHNLHSWTSLELIAIYEARKQELGCHKQLPQALEPLISRLARQCKSRTEKLLPTLNERLDAGFFEKVLSACIAKNSERLFSPPSDGSQTGFIRLCKERYMDGETYERLSMDSRGDDVLAQLDWWPFDDHRLKPEGEKDFLFASPVCTGLTSFIACIAPTHAAGVAQFWQLAAKEKVGLVVSLLTPKEFEGLSNHLISSKELGPHIILNEYGEGPQIHYTGLADGKALSPKELHFLITQVETHNPSGRPLLVHCQVGRGRTGFFCAAYEIYKQFQAGNLQPDVWSIVYQMNLQRPYMVAEFVQYKSLFEYLEFLKKGAE